MWCGQPPFMRRGQKLLKMENRNPYYFVRKTGATIRTPYTPLTLP